MTEHQEQPRPTGDGEIVYLAVIEDMRKRAEVGKSRYGTYLRTHNGRDALRDAYEEAMDLCMYLKQLMLEDENQ